MNWTSEQVSEHTGKLLEIALAKQKEKILEIATGIQNKPDCKDYKDVSEFWDGYYCALDELKERIKSL